MYKYHKQTVCKLFRYISCDNAGLPLRELIKNIVSENKLDIDQIKDNHKVVYTKLRMCIVHNETKKANCKRKSQ